MLIVSDSDPLFPPRPTALAHQILRPLIRSGDSVIDATAGNGYDTIFLAECVGSSGKVVAFDIQEAAIASAKSRIIAAGWIQRVDFFQQSHVQMVDHSAVESIALIMFNLGYLPGEDHAVTTESAETLRALRIAVGLLKPGGVISVICYPGHTSGAVEAAAVEIWATSLAVSGWRIAKYGAVGTRRPAPFLLLVSKSC